MLLNSDQQKWPVGALISGPMPSNTNAETPHGVGPRFARNVLNIRMPIRQSTDPDD